MAQGVDTLLNVRIQGVDAGASKTLAGVNTQVGKLGTQTKKATVDMEALSGTLTAIGISATVFGATLTAAFKGFVDVAANFETSMLKVKAISGAAGAEFTALADKAKDLGASTEYTASQVADGMRFLAMAGQSTAEILLAIGPTLDLATVGFLDLGQAADIVTNIMTPFGIEASKIRDVIDTLTITVNNSNTNIQELGEAMKYAGPIASKMGLSLEQAAAVMGVLANNGVKASLAGVQLRGLLASLAKPTKQAQQALDKMNVRVAKNADGTVDLIETFRRLAEAGLTATQAVTIFNRRMASGALILKDGLDSYDKLTDKLQTMSGASKEAADLFRSGFKGASDKLKSALGALKNTIGTELLGAVTELLKGITSVINFFQAAAEQSPILTKVLVALTGAFGALAVAVGGLLVTMAGITFLAGPWQQLKAAVLGVGTSIRTTMAAARASISNVRLAFTTLRPEIQATNTEVNMGAAAWRNYALSTMSANRSIAATNTQILSARKNVRAFVAGAGPALIGTVVAMTASFVEFGTEADRLGVTIAGIALAVNPFLGAIVGIGAGLRAILVYWDDLDTFLKDDLGIFYEINKVIIDWLTPLGSVLKALKRIYDYFTAASAKEKVGPFSTEELDKLVEKYTKGTKTLEEALENMTTDFVGAHRELTSEAEQQLTKAITRQIAKIRGEERQAAAAKRAEYNKSTEDAAKALDKEGKAAKETAKQIKESFKKEFKAIEKDLKSFDKQIAKTLKRAEEHFKDFERQTTSSTSPKEFAKAYEQYTQSIDEALGELAINYDQKITKAEQALQRVKKAGLDLAPLKEEMSKIAEKGASAFTSMAEKIGSALVSVKDKYQNTIRKIQQLTIDHNAAVTSIADNAREARRRILRSGLSDEQKYYESGVELARLLEAAKAEEAKGTEESFKRSQDLRRRALREAEALAKGGGGVSTAQGRGAALAGIQAVEAEMQRAQNNHDKAHKAKLEEQKRVLEEQKRTLAEMRTEANALVTKFEKFAAGIPVKLDMSAVDDALAKPREITVKVKPDTTALDAVTGRDVGIPAVPPDSKPAPVQVADQTIFVESPVLNSIRDTLNNIFNFLKTVPLGTGALVQGVSNGLQAATGSANLPPLKSAPPNREQVPREESRLEIAVIRLTDATKALTSIIKEEGKTEVDIKVRSDGTVVGAGRARAVY